MIEVNIYLITILHTNLDLTLEDRLNQRKEKIYRYQQVHEYALKCGVQSSQRITGHALVPQIKK